MMNSTYSIADLLAKCEPFPPSEDEKEWLNAPNVGNEIITTENKMKVHVFSKSNCPYCVMAKQFLERNDIAYEETNLDDEAEKMAFYAKCGPGVRSMPQIFVDDVRIGGYQDLMKSDILLRKGAGDFGESF